MINGCTAATQGMGVAACGCRPQAIRFAFLGGEGRGARALSSITLYSSNDKTRWWYGCCPCLMGLVPHRRRANGATAENVQSNLRGERAMLGVTPGERLGLRNGFNFNGVARGRRHCPSNEMQTNVYREHDTATHHDTLDHARTLARAMMKYRVTESGAGSRNIWEISV